jgi:hypothetical protein
MVCVSILIGIACVSPVFGQRDAPVWEAYLPSVSIYHDDSNNHDALTINLLFKKNGGPYQHTQHQAYVLVYLKKDEEQIMKLAGDSQLVRKRIEKAKQLVDLLIERKLVISLESQVAKLNSPNGRTPRFADVSGNPKPIGPQTLAEFSFPFKFTFTYETLWSSVRKLGNFNSEDVIDSAATWFNDKFKLMLFIPVNDSPYATKVSSELRKADDFAWSMDFETSLLYFRPLPYEFTFARYRENKLLLYIH